MKTTKSCGKKILSFLLALLMVVGLFSGMTMQVRAAEMDYSPGATAGTSSAPVTYNISNEAQLRDLATAVNNGTSYQYTTFVLQNDIALSGGAWTPIGTTDGAVHPFQGTFDGNNKKIAGIKIGSSSAPEVTLSNVGLFGYVRSSIIKNLGVEAEIHLKIVSEDINSSASSGGLVGKNDGTITNSYATGNIIVEGKMDNVRRVVAGGLAGWNTGTITNSYATANVTGVSFDYLGGLVGLNTGTAINNSYATGNVTCNGPSGFVGGLVGLNNGTAINNSYATGNLTCSGVSDFVGGLVGNNLNKVISNCYWNNNAAQTVNGAAQSLKKSVGSGTSDGVTSMTSDNMQADSFVATLNANLDTLADTALYKWQVKANDYPTFSNTLWSAPIITTIEKAITIGTVAPAIAEEMANGTVSVPTGATDPVVTWSKDNGISWTASGNFAAGTVYKTKYVYTANTGYQFDSAIAAVDISVTYLGNGTKNVVLTNSNKTLTITVTWPTTTTPPNWADGITATTTTWDSGGTITTAVELSQFAYNVNHGKDYSGQTITLGNDINLAGKKWTPIALGGSDPFKGTFDGNSKKITGIEIGSSSAPDNTLVFPGFFGYIHIGTVKNLGVDVAIYSNKDIAQIGGLAGYNDSTITNCYATGNVTGDCFAVTGLVGFNSNGTIADCHASADVTGIGIHPCYTGGLVGLNSGTIKDSYSTGNVICENNEYPSYVGGLAASNATYSTIVNSYATGNVTGGASIDVGGLVGYNNSGTIKNSYATGNGTGGASSRVGGLVGYSLNGIITNSYATGDVTGGASASIGGLVGSNAGYAPTDSYWNNDATQTVDGTEQSPKKAVGSGDTGDVTSMTSVNMKDPSFVTTLNNNIDLYEDTTLSKWKVKSNDYPTFLYRNWIAPTKITKAITIDTTAPVTAAYIADGICTQLEGASGPAITWSADFGASWTASGSFVANTYYKTKYVYTANEGYQFDRSMQATDITVTNLGSGFKFVEHADNYKTLTITVTWPITATAELVTIHGTVRDKGGNPITGATVTLTPGAGAPNPATTGNDGKYTINNVPAGNYVVTVTLPNGGGSFTKNITAPGGNMDIQQPTVPTYTVSGSIKDATDSPVSGATVTLTNTTDNTKIYTGTTDSNGNYAITGVPDGSYTVNVTKGGETYDCGNAGITVSGSNISGGSGNISATIPTYTVTYDGNVNDSGTAPLDSASYKKGAYARVMGKGSLVRNGYSFTGWNTESDGSGMSYKVNDTFVIKGNVTLYAQWKAVDSAQTPIFTSSNVRGIVAVTPAACEYELSVTAVVNDGGTLSYQWYERTDGTTAVAIGSATNSSYTPSTTSVGVTYYYVVVTNTLTTQSGVKTTTNTSSEKTVIVLAEPAASYPVSTNSTLNNITLDNTSATQYQNYTTNIIADPGYYLPDRITVTMGGRILTDGVDYIYSKTSTRAGTVTVYNVTGEIAITATGVLIPTKEYTISFNSNGADAAVPAISGEFGDTIRLPAPTKAGFSFAGWYRDSSFATSYASTTMGKEDITLFAKWEPITYNISGNVKDEDNANVNNASVRLMAGSRKVAQADTDMNGDFNISGVPEGMYNLVITNSDQTITITLVITVLNSNLTTGSVTLPKGKKNSVVEVKKDTPDIVVDKLNDFFSSDKFTQDDRNVVDAGGTVEVKLLVEEKEESGDNTAANADSIKTSAEGSGKAVGIFLNLTLSKIITPTGGAAEQPILIDELSDLLIINIPLPAELQGKSGYVIYRYHGAAVQTITELVNDGEYIEVSSDGKSIKLHTKKFSTYAVGYTTSSTPPANNTGDGSSNSAGGNAVPSTITIEPVEGGRIVIGTDNKTAAITPDNGYAIADVIVDGKSIGLTEKYTFTDGAAHKISAVFVKKTELPYYNQNGGKVYIGFSAIEGNFCKYIAPANVTVKFMENPKNFIDNSIAWAKPSIDFVTEREIFLGTGQNRFSPNAGMTRAMFVAVIGRLYERSYGSVSGTNTFSDVDTKDYYAKYVAWANKNGIIKGVGENKFDPNANVTREQMAVIMSKFAALLKKTAVADVSLTYPDSASISSWAIEGAKYCQKTKVIEGRTGGIFAPRESATRAEASAILQRFIANMLK